MPRRSPSVSSSVAPSRTATIASWRARRERSWAWASPVATAGTPSRSASEASQRLRERSWRQSGRCSSIRKRSGPKARSSRRASRAAPAGSPRSQLPATAPSRAQPERQTSPSVWRSSSSMGSDGGSAWLSIARVALARAAVGLGDQPAEARPAPRVLDQQGDVDRARHPPRHLHRQLAADDGADPDPRAGVRELHRATDVVVIGQGQGLVTEVRRSGRQLGRIGGGVQEGVGAVAVELYVVSRCRHQSRCRNQLSRRAAGTSGRVGA